MKYSAHSELVSAAADLVHSEKAVPEWVLLLHVRQVVEVLAFVRCCCDA